MAGVFSRPETDAAALAAVAAEAAARAAADTTLSTAIAAEATARGNAVSAEATARAAADTAHEADTTSVHGIPDTSKLAKFSSGNAAGTLISAVDGTPVLGGSGGTSTVATVIADAEDAQTLTAPASGERVYDVTLTEDCELTLEGGSNGYAATLTIRFRQDSTGGWTVTWPDTIDWSYRLEPLLTTTPDAYDVVVLFTTDSGATWSGFLAGSTLRPAAVPDAPLSLSGLDADPVVLTWPAAAPNGSPVTAYKIYRGNTSGTETLLDTSGSVLEYTDESVVHGNTYYYEVSAVNAIGEGAKSPEKMIVAEATTEIVIDLRASGLPAADSVVSTWTNDGTLADATGSGGTRPTARAAQFNGLKGAEFTLGSSTEIALPDLSALEAGSVFIVAKYKNPIQTNEALWDLGTDAFGPTFPYGGTSMYDDTGTTVRSTLGHVDDWFDHGALSGTADPYAPWLMEVHSTPTAWELRVNGTVKASKVSNTVGFRATPLLGACRGAFFFDGYIGEFRVVSGIMTGPEISAARTELATRHAITLD